MTPRAASLLVATLLLPPLLPVAGAGCLDPLRDALPSDASAADSGADAAYRADAGPPPPDAGAAHDAGGSVPADAGPIPACTERLAIQDVCAASWVPGVHPDPGDLNAEASAGQTAEGVIYLRFEPLAAPATRAVLRLHTFSTLLGGGSGEVCPTDAATWDEGSVTWANKPAWRTPCIGPERKVDTDEEVEWDVLSLMPSPGSSINLVTVPRTITDGVHYYSKESGGAARGPRLCVAQ